MITVIKERIKGKEEEEEEKVRNGNREIRLYWEVHFSFPSFTRRSLNLYSPNQPSKLLAMR